MGFQKDQPSMGSRVFRTGTLSSFIRMSVSSSLSRVLIALTFRCHLIPLSGSCDAGRRAARWLETSTALGFPSAIFPQKSKPYATKASRRSEPLSCVYFEINVPWSQFRGLLTLKGLGVLTRKDRLLGAGMCLRRSQAFWKNLKQKSRE